MKTEEEIKKKISRLNKLIESCKELDILESKAFVETARYQLLWVLKKEKDTQKKLTECL